MDATPDQPCTVAVVVPTRNRAGGLETVLRPLLDDPATTELVVVDDGSTDGTAELLDGWAADDGRIHVLHLEGRGAAGARQAGVEAASAEVVLFVDDDVLAAPGLVTGHRQRHLDAAGEVVVVGYMPVRLPTTRRPGDAATFLYDEEYEAHCRAWEADPGSILAGLWSGNLSMRRARCLEVPLPSPGSAIAYHEDQDFGLRLREAGATAVFDRSLRAEHLHRRPLDAFLRDAHRQGADRLNLQRAHPGIRLPLAGAPIRAIDRLHLGRPVLAGAVALSHLAGRLHLWKVETFALRLARQLEQRRGYREVAEGSVSVALR